MLCGSLCFNLGVAKIWQHLLELPKNDFDLKEEEQNTVGLIIKKKEEEEHVLSLHKCPSLRGTCLQQNLAR